MNPRERQQITEALVGLERRALYEQNAPFRFGVDTIVSLLPHWVKGLALEAEGIQRQVDREVEQAHHLSPEGKALADRLDVARPRRL